jgi:ribonuclease HI
MGTISEALRTSSRPSVTPLGTRKLRIGLSVFGPLASASGIRGLEEIDGPAEIEIRSDSEYLTRGMTEWIARWKANEWKTAVGKPVKNDDLWRQLDALAYGHKIIWVHVMGHAGDPMNERADQLARAAAQKLAANLGGAAAV